MNPPYKKENGLGVERFIDKLISEIELGNVGESILLVRASTDTNWFLKLVSIGKIAFSHGRVNFISSNGFVVKDNSPSGHCLIYVPGYLNRKKEFIQFIDRLIIPKKTSPKKFFFLDSENISKVTRLSA